MLVSLLLWFTVKHDLEDIEYDSEVVGSVESIGVLGDEETEAYHYWELPEDSMGMPDMKFVNWSYFRQLFLAHTDWMLEYKRYSYSSWTDGSQYLTIERTWHDSGFWKFNLILDVPVYVYSVRFTFGVDLPVLDYVERSGYEVWVNYTANATETYSVMFNWSDIASIPNLVITKGVQDGMFWFRFRRDNVPAGHYEFDPIFGSTTTGIGAKRTIKDRVLGDYFQMGELGGVGVSISAYLSFNTAGDQEPKYRFLLYDSDLNLVAETSEGNLRPGYDGTDWFTKSFVGSPNLVGDAWYYLCAWANNLILSDADLHFSTAQALDVFYDDEVYNGAPDPFARTILKKVGIAAIYCTYTEYNQTNILGGNILGDVNIGGG